MNHRELNLYERVRRIRAKEEGRKREDAAVREYLATDPVVEEHELTATSDTGEHSVSVKAVIIPSGVETEFQYVRFIVHNVSDTFDVRQLVQNYYCGYAHFVGGCEYV